MISDGIWDDDESLGPALIVRRYEAAWRDQSGFRPKLTDFVPAEPGADPAALSSLLRADLSLRCEAGESPRVEEYLEQFPHLPGDVVVALLYEEFCLREEAGEHPALREFEERFPTLAEELREVLEIHSLVRSGRSAMPSPCSQDKTPFPSAGQTIAGFRLVEELGRGTFARVFRAEERLLADRPVALKVTRTPSREPQALARLQHTHIVPVYSYRTDPVSGLHLLCMPYLGRVTLADLLAHLKDVRIRSGQEFVAALDQLGAADAALAETPAARIALSARSHARAIAWWGARLAQALQHAHDRGILHRDIKPSNVLVTADALPMLLDFNLAHESWIDDPTAVPSALGGTLAYMAPEHLESIADGTADRVDGRADIFALGVVLFEALAGRRPFSLSSEILARPDFLRNVAKTRRAETPRLRNIRPDLPPELDAVVARCLAPRPRDRYAAASELADDLQAVADDAPLRFAQEPLLRRSARWVRRNRRTLGLAVPAALVLMLLAFVLVNSKLEEIRVGSQGRKMIADAENSLRKGEPDKALGTLVQAKGVLSDKPGVRPLVERAELLIEATNRSIKARDRADEFFRNAESLRVVLLGFGGEPEPRFPELEETLQLFSIKTDPVWFDREDMHRLDPARYSRVRGDAEDLLFLWVVALDRGQRLTPELAADALRICDLARPFVPRAGPWAALRARYTNSQMRAQIVPRPNESSARICFQWGLLFRLEKRLDLSIEWLARAVNLRADDYWANFYLAYLYDRAGRVQPALAYYSSAISVRKDAPWAYLNRAKIFYQHQNWTEARTDLDHALAIAHGGDLAQAHLESGTLREQIGDLKGARKDYESAINAEPKSTWAHAARLNLAKLDLLAGDIERARATFESLLAAQSTDRIALRYRALLSLHTRRPDHAEADLSRLIPQAVNRDDVKETSELFALRALARLGQGRNTDAVSDAAIALRAWATPSHERLWFRTLLASGRERDYLDLLLLDDPDDLDRLPGADRRLRDDLRKAAAWLEEFARHENVRSAPALRTRAVLLSWLGDRSALAEAQRAFALAPDSADSALVIARIRRRAGDLRGALTDVEKGLAVSSNSPRLLELRGLLAAEIGHPADALKDLDLAVLRGARATCRAARAQALLDIGQAQQALEAWTSALGYDPEDPRAYLGRARTLMRLKRWDSALADLENATVWSQADPRLLARTTLIYAACLPARPSRLPRVLALARQSLGEFVTSIRAAPLFALPFF